LNRRLWIHFGGGAHQENSLWEEGSTFVAPLAVQYCKIRNAGGLQDSPLHREAQNGSSGAMQESSLEINLRISKR
jgi:hypothetical protein